jgi:hypothetical protein
MGPHSLEMVDLDVAATAIGIPEEDQAFVVKAFQETDGSVHEFAITLGITSESHSFRSDFMPFSGYPFVGT